MASLNKVLLIGNLTKDPGAPRKTPKGMSVIDLRMALHRKYKASDGSMMEEVCYVNVTAWDRQADNCAQYLSKGAPIMVEGRLKFDEWEKNGQKQSRLSVVAERIQFLGGPRQRVEPGAAPADVEAPPQSAPARDDGRDDGGQSAPPSDVDDDNLPF